MSTSSETVPEVFDPSKQSRKFRQLRSKPIRFIIGKEREEFYLNSGFLSQLSQSLNDIVRNNIAESSQSCIVWEDFDPTVFEQFAEFAYTGDYTCNLPTKLGKDTSEPPKRYTDDTFTLPYSLISYNTSAQNRHLAQNHAAESVEHLIGDVQMYIIADRYTITSLMDTPGHGQPRQVVASFAVCVARDVSALEGWATLLEDVPDFAWDLLGQVTKRRPVSPQPMADSSQPILGFPFGRKPQGYN
ncbi:hypothetical protein F4824DRAFT_504295 [Ustulina deusta]|nr:hypothetical protein F4824DRAFT_504295 [Ustulina deusta]